MINFLVFNEDGQYMQWLHMGSRTSATRAEVQRLALATFTNENPLTLQFRSFDRRTNLGFYRNIARSNTTFKLVGGNIVTQRKTDWYNYWKARYPNIFKRGAPG